MPNRAVGGTHAELKLDIHRPSGAGAYPLVVFVTGGGFVFAMKSANVDRRSFIAEHGYVVASIEYRTAVAGATYRDSVADVKSAIRYLRAHAEESVSYTHLRAHETVLDLVCRLLLE